MMSITTAMALAMRVTGAKARSTPITVTAVRVATVGPAGITAMAASAAADTVGIDVTAANAVVVARAGAGVPARRLGGTFPRARSR